MKKNNFKLLNAPFAGYDRREGEQVLANSSLFREHALSLCCGVTLCDLSRADGTNPWNERLDRELIDYLVCRSDDVLMAIDVSDREAWLGKRVEIEGLPTAETSASRMEQGDVSDILAQLEEILRANAPPEWKYPLCGLSEDAARRSGDIRLAEASGEPGMPAGCGRLGGAELLLKMMTTPLDTYMQVDCFPEEFGQLTGGLSNLCTTYGEAACAIYDMLQSDSREQFDRGAALMRALAFPMNALGSMPEQAALGVNIYGKRRPPKRYRDAHRSFDKRADCFSKELPAEAQLTFAEPEDFFMGVGSVTRTGSGYALRFSETLREEFGLSRDKRFGEIVRRACEQFDEGGEARKTGIRLLYRLLVEPFALMHNKLNTEKSTKELS